MCKNTRSSESDCGTLYLVATPIGNLADISQRAIEILSTVDIIAAEDTRHSQRLLNQHAIKSKLLSYHEHNEENTALKILHLLEMGQHVALISDAGTPLISDPGYRLVSLAQEKSFKIVPIPGACAAITALSASGIATNSFSFEGFTPAKHVARCLLFKKLATYQQTLIFYVSCHRIIETLEDMLAIFGETRQVTFARELTKTFETIKKMPLQKLLAWVSSDENQRKGEIVLVVAGNQVVEQNTTQHDQNLSILLAELPLKQAVKLLAKMTGSNKNDLYKRALELKELS